MLFWRYLCFFILVNLYVFSYVSAQSNVGDSLKRTGVKYKNRGDFSGALKFYELAKDAYEVSKDSVGIATVYNNKGIVWYYLGDFVQAYSLYEKSYEIYKKLGYKYGIGLVNINLGNYYAYESRNIEEALKCYEISREIFIELKNSHRLLVVINNIGNLFNEKFKKNFNDEYYDSTKRYYRKSIEIAERLKQGLPSEDSLSSSQKGEYAYLLNQIGGTQRNLADLFSKNNKIDSALSYYDLALKNFSKTNNQYSLAGVYLNLGDFYLKRKQFKNSLAYNSRALGISKNYRYWDFIHGASKNLAQLYEQTGDYDSAAFYYSRYIEANDTVYNRAKLQEIEKLETRFETEKKDQEIKIQKAQLELTNAEKERLMYILLISLGFTVIIIYIYTQRQRAVKNLRKKEEELHTQEVGKLIQEQELKSINAMLEGEEKERRRIAEDLHDRVGSMLAAMKLQSDPANEKMVGLLDETADEVRRISHNLETQVLNRFGLAAALEDLAEKIKSSGKIEFELHHLDLDERLDNKIEINAYRIVQELISNALKHSQASAITAQVNCLNDQLIIMVEDNGIGFDSLGVKKQGGMGLNNVASRAQELNGSFNVDSGKGQGTVITIEIPL